MNFAPNSFIQRPCRPKSLPKTNIFLGLHFLHICISFLSLCLCLCLPTVSATYLNFTRAYTGKDKRDLYPLMPVICSIKLPYATEALPADLTLSGHPSAEPKPKPKTQSHFKSPSRFCSSGKRSLHLLNECFGNMTTYAFILFLAQAAKLHEFLLSSFWLFLHVCARELVLGCICVVLKTFAWLGLSQCGFF